MNEFEFDKSTQIGGWFMPKNICDDIVNYFNNNKKLQVKGLVFNNSYESVEDKNEKESTEIIISPNFNNEIFYNYRITLQKVLNLYLKKYERANTVPSFNVNEDYNVQYYKKNGGFKTWHYENSFKNEKSKKRCLVFMTYLNDVEDGGTEFLYQNLVTPAKKGLTLIWPPYWTHTHRGQISKTKQKYIVTGWFSFNE